MTGNRRIAIIGGGFSGTILAIHLLRQAEDGDRILLFEKSPPSGRGVAYGTTNDSHLLNVRAANMGAFEDDPGGFLTWLNGPQSGDIRPLARPVAREVFAPRRQYGRYLQHCLEEALSEPGKEYLFRPVAGEASDIDKDDTGLVVRLTDGRTFEVDRVVLAMGNQPPDKNRLPLYAGDPWHEAALADLQPDAELLLVGTGLTMIDTVLSLIDRGHRGRIHAVSRRGLLPQPHPSPAFASTPMRLNIKLPETTLGLMRMLRREVKTASEAGHNWHEVMQALRPHVQLIWTKLPREERARFLRHLRPWWDTHRHCIAPRAAARIRTLIKAGQLNVMAGRLVSENESGEGMEVVIRPRGKSETERLLVSRIINCTGPRRDHAGGQSELLRNLLASGMVRPDPLELGLDVDPDGFVLDRQGHRSSQIAAVGPLTRGTLWEVTAVPEIRRQCATAALRISEAWAERSWAPLSGPLAAETREPGAWHHRPGRSRR